MSQKSPITVLHWKGMPAKYKSGLLTLHCLVRLLFTYNFRLGLQWTLSSERISAIVQESHRSKHGTVIRNHSRIVILTSHYCGICDLQSVRSAAKTAFHCFFFVKLCIQVSSYVKSPKYNIPSWTTPSLKMKALLCVAGPGFLYLETQRFIL